MVRPKRESKAEVTEYKYPKTAAGGSGSSGDGDAHMLKLVDPITPEMRELFMAILKRGPLQRDIQSQNADATRLPAAEDL